MKVEKLREILEEKGGHRNCIPNKGMERTKSWRAQGAQHSRKPPLACSQKAESKGNVLGSEDRAGCPVSGRPSKELGYGQLCLFA